MPTKLVWITGATSFLGSRIGTELEALGYEVVKFARMLPSSLSRSAAMSFEVGPFSRELLVKALERPRAPAFVVHCIGSGSVGIANADPAADAERTLGSVTIVSEFLKQTCPSARLVYLSSAAVYGSSSDVFIAESCTPQPLSVYGRNKFAAESICRRSGCRVTIVRLFSVYGSPQRKLLFWELGQRLISGENPVLLGGRGDEARDFIHVSDAASAIIQIAEADECLDVINVGSGRSTTVQCAADSLRTSLRASSRIEFSGVARPGDPRRQVADVGRLKTLGFEARMNDLRGGLAEYADWLTADRDANAAPAYAATRKPS